MARMMMLIYLIAGPTLAGILIVVALVGGLETQQPILIAAITGFVAALPVSWFVARQLADRG